jgi:peptide/nickel transport system substrate-binding protein
VGINIHRSLYKWDTEKNVPVPDLAESVSVSDDGLVFTYKLRPNIKFHNGRQLVADDIIWSYTRIAAMKPDSPQLRYIKSIKGVDAVNEGKAETISGFKKIDDLTFEMTLEDPVDIKYYLWLPGMAIVPKEEWNGWGMPSPPTRWAAARLNLSNGSRDPKW